MTDFYRRLLIQSSVLLIGLCCFSTTFAFAGCSTEDNAVFVQVLGSGGPELTDKRASSSYLIWHNGKAKLLVDVGSGSMFNFELTDAKLNDIEAVMLSHLHVDHTADIPAFIKASFFSDRNKDLLLWGPSGNQLMPATTDFIDRLFARKGAYPYLSSYLTGNDTFQILANNVAINAKQPVIVARTPHYTLSALPVTHGSIPALAWKVSISNKVLVFSGDTNGVENGLVPFTKDANLFIAHHAIPEGTTGVARQLHMPPSKIGQIAKAAKIKQLLLSHHMNRSLNDIKQSKNRIQEQYAGPLHFAKDLACYKP